MASFAALMKQRLHTEQEFKSGNRMTRILISLINERFHLTPTEEKYLARMRRCFTIYTTKYSDHAIDKVLKKEFPTMNSAQLRTLKRDTKTLYGNFNDENKQFSKIAQIERLKILLGIIKKEKPDRWGETLVRIEALLAKLEGNDREVDAKESRRLPIPRTISFSSDPKYLHRDSAIEPAIIEE